MPLDKILGPDWRRDDFSGVGEIDLRVILRQWGGDEIAAKLAPAWRGGYYMALTNKKSPKDAPLPLALVLRLRLARRGQSSSPPSTGARLPSVTSRFSLLRLRIKRLRIKHSRVSGSPKKAPCCSTSTAPRSSPLESFTPEDAAKIHAALVPVDVHLTAQ